MTRAGPRSPVVDVSRRLEPHGRCSPTQEPIGLLISSARSRIKQAVLARAAGHRLAVQQFWFVIALCERPGISQVELAESVRSDAPTTSRVISTLTRRGLVRADPTPDARRRRRLFLTSAGERLAKDLSGTAKEIRAAIVDGMTGADQEALRGGLRRVIANLDRLESS
jgi:DNA-binding MarR family transcriptional regulator